MRYTARKANAETGWLHRNCLDEVFAEVPAQRKNQEGNLRFYSDFWAAVQP
jgi:hypothetical protein